MNATPTPQLIETDLRKIFSNEIEMNVSRAAATQNHNETKTTTQARQPKVMQSDGNVKTSTNDYTAYNFKQVSLGRPLMYEGGDNTKRPDGPKLPYFVNHSSLTRMEPQPIIKCQIHQVCKFL